MADIKQAAKWMQEGKRVRCPLGFVHYGTHLVFIGGDDPPEAANLYTTDLLSDEWELAED